MDNIISLLMDMQRACPVNCYTSISMETLSRDPIIFRWEYKIKKKRYVITNAISWLELQSRNQNSICFDKITAKIKKTFENEAENSQ